MIQTLKHTCNDDDELYNYIINCVSGGLTRNKKERWFFNFTGCGSNGKTFILELLASIYENKYVCKLNNNIVQEKGQNKHKAFNKFSKAVLGIGFFDEIDNNNICLPIIKNLTGGKEMENEKLFKDDDITIKLRTQIYLISNTTLKFNTVEKESLITRGRSIEFKNYFHDSDEEYEKFKGIKGHYKSDKDYITNLTEEQKQAFIFILKPGFESYYKNGGILDYEKAKEAFKIVCDDNDKFKQFLDMYYIITNDDNDKLKPDDLIEKYNEHYKLKNNYKRSALWDDIKRTGLKYNPKTNFKGGRGTIYGIREKTYEDDMNEEENNEEKDEVEEVEDAAKAASKPKGEDIVDERDIKIKQLEEEIERLKKLLQEKEEKKEVKKSVKKEVNDDDIIDDDDDFVKFDDKKKSLNNKQIKKEISDEFF